MRALYPLVLTLMIASCGGGDNGNDTPPDTNETTEFGTIVFNENDDSFAAIPASLTLAEAIQQVTQATVNTITRFAYKGQPVEIIYSTNTAMVTLVDNDSNLVISSGDKIMIEYLGEYNYEVSDKIDGELSILIENFIVEKDKISFSGIIDYTQTPKIGETKNEQTAISGKHKFSYSFKKNSQLYDETLLTESLPNQEINFITPEGTEVIGAFNIEKVTSQNEFPSNYINTKVSYDIFYKEGTFNDSFTCNTKDYSLESELTYVICKGKNNNSIRWSNNHLPIEIDKSGSGKYASTELGIDSPASFLEGFLLQGHKNNFPDNYDTLPTRNLFTQHSAITTLNKNKSLIIARETSSGYELSAYTPAIGKIQKLRELPAKASILHLTEDESTLYIAFEDSNLIQKLSTADFSLIKEINVGIDREILDLDTADNKPELLAVAVKKLDTLESYNLEGGDVLIFINDEKLARTYADLPQQDIYFKPRIDKITFSSTGEKLFCGVDRSTAAATLSIDSTGVSGETKHYNSIIGGKLIRHKNKLYTGSKFIIEDELLSGGWAFTRGSSAFDDTNKMIFASESSFVRILDIETHSSLGDIRIDLADGSPYGPDSVHTLDNSLFIATKNLIRQVSIEDIQKIITKTNCDPTTIKNNMGQDVLELSCFIRDIAYSPEHPDKFFAAISSQAGSNGNSIAIISKDSLEISSFIPLISEPSEISISGDGNSLYVTFMDANYIGRIDLDSDQKDLSLIPIFTSEPFKAIEQITIKKSPAHGDLFVSPSENSRFYSPDKLDIYINSEKSAYSIDSQDVLAENQVDYNPRFEYAFGKNGKLYTFIDYINDTVIKTFSLSESGATIEATNTVNDGDRMYVNFSIADEQIIFADGIVIDLTLNTAELKYIKPNINISFAAQLPSITENKVYFLGDHYSSQGATVYVYNKSSGDYISSFNIIKDLPSWNNFYKPKLIETSDSIIIKPDDKGSIYIAPKIYLN